MIAHQLKRGALRVLFVCLMVLIGASWSPRSEPPRLDDVLEAGVAGFAATNEGTPLCELTPAEQKALATEMMANLWRYRHDPDAPHTSPRTVTAANGLIAFVNESAPAIIYDPHWSPDGERLAFFGRLVAGDDHTSVRPRRSYRWPRRSS